MVKTQLDIPEDINQRLLIYRHTHKFKNKESAIIGILCKYLLFDNPEDDIVDVVQNSDIVSPRVEEVDIVGVDEDKEGKVNVPYSPKDSNFGENLAHRTIGTPIPVNVKDLKTGQK